MRTLGPALFSVLATLLASAPGCGSKGASAAPEHLDREFRVRCVEAATRIPVEGIRVTAFLREIALPPRTTDAAGWAGWTAGAGSSSGIRQGSSLLSVEDPEGRYQRAEVELGALETLPEETTVELRRGVTIRLGVRGAGGDPIAAKLEMWPAGRTTSWRVEVPAEGALELGPVAPGQAKVLVSAAGHAAKVVDLFIPPKGGDLGEIALEAGGTALTGRVAPSLEVRPDQAYFRFGGAGTSVPVARDGSFRFEGLPETDGTLVLRHGGEELFSRRGVRVAGDSVDLGVIRP